jgi:hypothetical protein
MKRAMTGLLVVSSSLLFTTDGSAQQVGVAYTPAVFHWKVEANGNVTGDKWIHVDVNRVDTAPFCWKISEVELRFDGKRVDSSLQNNGAGSCSFAVTLNGAPITDDEARSYCPGPGHTGPGGDRTFKTEVDLVTDTTYAAYEPLRRWVQPWDYSRQDLLFVHSNPNTRVHVECASADRCVKPGECSSPPDASGITVEVACGTGKCVKGVCYPRDCGICRSGICSDGICLDMCAAHSHPCGPNTFCDEAKVECVINPGCDGVICPAGRRCLDGACVVGELCVGVACAPDHVCVNGTCHENPCAGITCPAGKVCYNGGCVIPESCLGVECATGLVCVAGSCVAPPCPETPCAIGRICQGGKCVPDPRCEGVLCDAGRVCSEGRCVPAPPKVPCPPGDVVIGGKCVKAQPSPHPGPGPQPQPH